jgi:DNA-binding beta-propeller fold protein YncE
VSAIRTSTLTTLVVAWCAVMGLIPRPTFSQTLKNVGFIDVPGPKGQRFDYLTLDAEDHYLLSAHLGPGILYVVDVRSNSVVKAIPGVPGITGVEYIPGLRKIYTSDWGEEKIGVVDLKQMKVVKRLPTAEKPNGSAYAAGFRKIYVSNTNGKAMTVVNVDTDEIVKTLEFGSETGMPQYDSVAHKVYVNLRSTNEIAAVDPVNDSIVERYKVPGCQYNHGMAIDSEHHRAFLLCGGNRTLTVLALDTRETLGHFPLPQGADVIKFDPGIGRAYAACASGFISVVQEDDPRHFRKLEDFPVQKLVHSLAVDTDTHRVYAPEQQEDGLPVARIMIYEAVLSPPAKE